MELYFKDEQYMMRVLASAKNPPESNHSLEEAFLLCLRPAGARQLDHLSQRLTEIYPELTSEEGYRLTRGAGIPGKLEFSHTVCRRMYSAALELLESGIPLGSENSALWGHLILEGKVAGQLAAALGLDPERAQKMGMLHDFGRTVTGTLEHTVRGYEILSDIGWEAEALGCLTHSFLAGGRCASNEQAESGFYVDAQGNPCWQAGAVKDHVSQFLEVYQFTDYDLILNIADLMATSWAILPPAERVADIATRRVIDPVNRRYFLSELTNRLWEMAGKISHGAMDIPKRVKADEKTSLEEIEEAFVKSSQAFYRVYQTVI